MWNLITHVRHAYVITYFYCTKLFSLLKYKNRVPHYRNIFDIRDLYKKTFTSGAASEYWFSFGCLLVMLGIYLFSGFACYVDQCVFIKPSSCWGLSSNSSSSFANPILCCFPWNMNLPQPLSKIVPFPGIFQSQFHLKQGDHEWKWDSTQGQRHTTSSRGSQLGVKWPVIFFAISSLFWRRWKRHTRLMVLFLGKAKVSLVTLGQKDRRTLGSSDGHLKFAFQGFLENTIWVLDRDHVQY